MLPCKIWEPGKFNSKRIKIDKFNPIIPAQNPKKRYKDPISLWLVEYNHLEIVLSIEAYNIWLIIVRLEN